VWPSTADRRSLGSWSGRRRPWWRHANAVVWLFATPRPGGLVLALTCALASESATHLPLAFAIEHPLNRLAAGRATVASLAAARLVGHFMAARPVAQGSWRKSFCCVTTRRRNLRGVRCLRRRWHTPTARTFCLGVLDFGRLILTPSGLPPRRLPTPEQTLAFGVLAVTLVPTPRLVRAPTTLTQADPCSRSSRTATAAAVWLIMMETHGSRRLPRDSPGRTRSRSPRALLHTALRTSANLYFRAETRQRRKRLEKGTPRRRANQTGTKQN
jgi:hypothetical protein